MKSLPADHHARGILFGIAGLLTFTAYLSINRYVYLHYHVSSFKYTATFLFASGVVALTGLTNKTTRSRLGRLDHLTFLTIANGLVGAAAMGLLIIGQNYTSAVNASIIASATTIPTIIFSYFMLHDSFTGRQLVWFLVLLVGLYFAIVGEHLLHLQKGDLIILSSLVFFGFGNVFTKKLLAHTPGGTLTDIRIMTTGLVF
jgi:drug/metabolite transporter (DMT)-like permease